METTDTFGANLRAAREAAGLTQAQLGAGLASDGSDLRKATVSAWEVGRNTPDVHQLRAICQRLNVSADHLLGRPEPGFSDAQRRALAQSLEDALFSHHIRITYSRADREWLKQRGQEAAAIAKAA